ncbi:MAG: hypothetical protein Q9217_006630, partial [Psora testacea]
RVFLSRFCFRLVNWSEFVSITKMSYSTDSNDSSNNSKSGDRELLTDEEVLKEELCDRILEVNSTGSFATFGIIDSFVHPGISVDPIGTVRLPLSEEDAHTLVQASHKSPFGKGTETVIDESQIDAWEIQFLNKSWQRCLDRTVAHVARELGVAGGSMNVRAEFYKMLLYEEGAMFKAHKDTEKVPGMFGTLVICLPSRHTGGAIEPVQTGYRWVLTYNLINESEDPYQSASALDERIGHFTQRLTRWQTLKDAPQFLAYPLDHQYTDRDLRLARLKGEDYHRARYVAQSCAMHGEFYVLLANMAMHITDPNDENESEEGESELLLSHIVDLEGSNLSVHVSLTISESLLLRGISYSDREPDVHRGGNYMGNQYAEIDQIFKDSVMIIVPSRFIMSFLLGSEYSHKDLNRLMRRLGEYIKTRGKDANLYGLLLQICHSSLSQKYESDEARDLYLGPVAVAAAFMRDASLFTKTVKSNTRSFEKDYYYALGELICLQDLVLNEHDVIEALTKSKKLHQIYENLSGFRDGFLQENSARRDEVQVVRLQQWLDSLTYGCFIDLERVYAEDASTLVRIILDHEKESFSQFVLYQGARVFVKRFQGDGILTNALMIELFLHLQYQDCSKIYLENLLQLITESTISNFDLPRFATYIKTRAFKSPLWNSRAQGEKETQSIRAGPIKAFYERVSTHERGTPSRLLGKIQTQASALTAEQSKVFLVSLLEELLPVVDVFSVEVQECIQSLITIYVTQTVGKEPRKPSDWARPEEMEPNCCDDCSKMNAFLAHPELQHYNLSCKEVWHLRSQYHCFGYFKVDEVDWKPVAVTKTLKWWEEQHQKWESRASIALEALRKLPQAKLKDCLTHRYDEIMDLRIVKVIDDFSKSTSQGNHRYETRSTVPQKRPRADL